MKCSSQCSAVYRPSMHICKMFVYIAKFILNHSLWLLCVLYHHTPVYNPLFNLIGNSERIPSRVSDDSAGYTLFSSEMKVIESGCTCVMETNVTVSMPRGFYARICNLAGKGLSAQTVSGDIIDGEYKRTISVQL